MLPIPPGKLVRKSRGKQTPPRKHDVDRARSIFIGGISAPKKLDHEMG